MLKFILRKINWQRRHYNMVCDWGLSTILMGMMPFCGVWERNQWHVVSCKCKQSTPAVHWDVPIQSHLAMKLAAKSIFNTMKVTVIGICTRFHFNPEVGWNSVKPWQFLQLKQSDLFSPLHCWHWTKQQTDEICLAYMLKVSFQSHQDSATKQMIKKTQTTKSKPQTITTTT